MPARAFRIRGTALPITGKPGRSKFSDSASLVDSPLGGVGVISVTAVARTTGVEVGVNVGNGGCVGVGKAVGVGVIVGVGVGVLVGIGAVVGVGMGVLVGVGVGVSVGVGVGVGVGSTPGWSKTGMVTFYGCPTRYSSKTGLISIRISRSVVDGSTSSSSSVSTV